MTIFLFIRHGENDFITKQKLPGQLPGIQLNDKGRQQAELLAQTLNPLPISVIFSSPLERAMQTASPLAASLQMKIKERPGLMDTDVGKWAGCSIKNLKKTQEWKNLENNVSEFCFPGGESFLHIQERVLSELLEIKTHYSRDTVAVVFHADPIKLAVAKYIGLPMGNFQRMSISPGSVSILQVGKDNVNLLALNAIPPFDIGKYIPGIPSKIGK